MKNWGRHFDKQCQTLFIVIILGSNLREFRQETQCGSEEKC